MSRLRLVCSAPPMSTVGGVTSGVLPSMGDLRVTVLSDDGAETELTNVESVTWTCSGAEPARVTITFVDTEADLSAALEDVT